MIDPASQLEKGIALSRQFAKQQLWNAIAMLGSAILAYYVAGTLAVGPDSLSLSMAAATGLTVGVCCAPNDYRSRSGSLALAIVLVAAMWSVPLMIIWLSIFE